MAIAEILILAFALSIDALIVSFSYGLILNKEKYKYSIILAFAFGFFQFLMPIIGWYLSSCIYSLLEIFSKWIVFSVFMFLSIRFIKSAFSQEEIRITCITLKCLFFLAIATSIDALGAGISLKFTNVTILIPSIIIGTITFIDSVVGFWTANIFKKIPSKYIELFGGLLLLYLAIKSIII